MSTFNKRVYRIIEKSDIVIEILDARFIEQTMNTRIEDKIRSKNKILVHVINKCDFVEKGYLEHAKRRLENCVFVSAKKHLGTTMLKQKIRMLASKNRIERPIVGVVGYPNVGKSSVINALKGRCSAKTSPEAGYTKGEQYVRIRNNFLMIDTPGVIAKEKNKEDELVLIGAKNPYAIKDPDLAVITLLEEHPGLVEDKYGVETKKNKEATLKEIALKLNLKRKGNLPDIERASRKILEDWISGKIVQK